MNPLMGHLLLSPDTEYNILCYPDALELDIEQPTLVLDIEQPSLDLDIEEPSLCPN